MIAFCFGVLFLFIDKSFTNDYIIGAVTGLVFFLLIIFFSRLILKKDGMGLGDAKFMCVIGLMTGIVNTACVILFSFIFGSIGVTFMLLRKKKVFGQEIAFGPYIVIAVMVMMFFGGDILNWYFNLL